MRIYAAGYLTFHSPNNEDMWITEQANPTNLLESYFYLEDNKTEYVRHNREKWHTFLDSGAFSAFSRGASIDHAAYLGYAKREADLWDHVAVLDVIGDADASWKNYLVMREEGIDGIPCFHYGEPWEFLDMMTEKAKYIAIGGVAQLGSGDALIEWLDSVWGNHLVNPDGTPKVQVHGFAVTSNTAMLRYPWESVDSTSWVRQAAFGRILVDIPGREGAPLSLPLSDESPDKEDHDRHFDSMNPILKESIRAYIEGRGYKMQDLKEKYRWRQHWNINYFRRCEERAATRFIRPQDGLFF